MGMGRVVWLTGLPCSGKTTIAGALKGRLNHAVILDGDDIRNTPISNDLGFSPEDRMKHLLRIGAIADIIAKSGNDVICAFVSPSKMVRDEVRGMCQIFIEVHVDATPEVCEERDIKGMWAKARAGEIENFTGFNAPYDEPVEPEVHIDTIENDVATCVDSIVKYIEKNFSKD